jgi:glycosyltransferase involved in cell wall biosynthesis
MKKILIIGTSPQYLINFREDLIKALVASGHQVTAMAAEVDQEVVAALAVMGVEFHSYPVQRNAMNPLKDIQTLLALRQAIDTIRPDIVLAYTVKPVVWGGLSLYGQAGIQFYALIEGLGYAFQQGNLARQALTVMVAALYRMALSRAKWVIFLNPDNRDLFTTKKIIDQCKCCLINGIGVNLQRFPHTPLSVGGVVFLTIGRLLREKGFWEYAQAAAIVRKSYPDVRFLVLGPEDPSPDGIPLAEVRQWEAVEYLGETRDVRPYLAACHVYVLPSYHEGVPRTVLEAMSMGRPIITTNAPGCRETIKLAQGQTLDKNSKEIIGGENGFLVPVKNVEKLAQAMEQFITHPELMQQMGRNSRKLAEEKYDVHKVNELILQTMGLD